MSFQKTERQLQQWGYWKKSHGINIGYGSNVLAVRKPIGYDLTDDQALAVDRAVSELKMRTVGSNIGKLVEDYFLEPSLSFVDLGKKYKIGKHKARELIFQGVSWIDAKIISAISCGL